MGQRHPRDYIERRLLSRSAVNVETPLVAGCHCRDAIKGVYDTRKDHDYGRMTDGEKLQYMHRLAHEVWIGPIPAGLDVMHRCDRPRCIEPRHIRAGTSKENSEDMVRKGRHLLGVARSAAKRKGQPNWHGRGAKHPRAKLNETQVRAIAADPRQGQVIADQYGISLTLVYRIKNGLGWGWLTMERVRPSGKRGNRAPKARVTHGRMGALIKKFSEGK